MEANLAQTMGHCQIRARDRRERRDWRGSETKEIRGSKFEVFKTFRPGTSNLGLHLPIRLACRAFPLVSQSQDKH